MNSTLAERLKDAMSGPPKVTGAAIARACKIKPPSVSDWLTGKTKTIEGSNLLATARLLNVRPEWLATGLGPKRPGHVFAEEPMAAYGVTDAQKQAMALIPQLSPQQLQEAVTFMKWQLANKAPPTDGQALSVAA